ncbi:MAG: hypothetical protein IKO78_01700 [Bacilli bacterium]|nr:hypothetical protein [Bacilli bacterium]
MNEEETLYINSDILDKFMSGVNKCSLKIGDHIVSSEKDYKKLKENDLYGDGFNKVEKGMNETNHTMINCNKVNEEFLTKYILLEEKGKEIIDDLYIPNDLKTGNEFSTSLFNQTNLNKDDSNSIKTYMMSDSKTEDEYNVVKEEIVNDNKNLDYDVEIENIDVNKENINNLNKEISSEAKADEEVTVKEANLDYVENNKVLDDNVVENINVSKEELHDVDNKIVIDNEFTTENQNITNEDIPLDEIEKQDESLEAEEVEDE